MRPASADRPAAAMTLAGSPSATLRLPGARRQLDGIPSDLPSAAHERAYADARKGQVITRRHDLVTRAPALSAEAELPPDIEVGIVATSVLPQSRQTVTGSPLISSAVRMWLPRRQRSLRRFWRNRDLLGRGDTRTRLRHHCGSATALAAMNRNHQIRCGPHGATARGTAGERASGIGHPHDRLVRPRHPCSPVAEGLAEVRHRFACVARTDPLATNERYSSLALQGSHYGSAIAAAC